MKAITISNLYGAFVYILTLDMIYCKYIWTRDHNMKEVFFFLYQDFLSFVKVNIYIYNLTCLLVYRVNVCIQNTITESVMC